MCASETVIYLVHYTLHTKYQAPPDYDTTFFISFYLFIIILANNAAHWEVEREELVAFCCAACDNSV